MKEKDLENSAEYVAGFADGFKSGLSKNFVQNHLVGKEFDCDDDVAFFEGYNKGCSDFCEQFIRLINGDDYISAYEMTDWLEDKRNEAEAATEAGYDEPEAFPSHPPIIIFTRILDFVEDLKEGAYRKIQKWQDADATEEYVDTLFGLIDGLDELQAMLVKEDVERHYAMRDGHK